MEYPFKQILIFFIYVSLIVVCGFMAEKKGRHVFLGVLAGVFLPLVSLIFFFTITG